MANYRKAVDKGLLKILSKMGISLLTSYHGAQIFEALGIADNVIMTAFKGTLVPLSHPLLHDHHHHIFLPHNPPRPHSVLFIFLTLHLLSFSQALPAVCPA